MAMPLKAVLLMGPTASGKTDIAIELAERYPCDIISVDSAMVYRGMNIGTAKPDADTLRRAPHRLVDIIEPEDSYSAGQFVRDAELAIRTSHANNRLPLLVGGTMMYFRALTQGMAALPPADRSVRAEIDAEAALRGWPALHAALAEVDGATAARLNPNDSQRIQRALEVFRVSGRPISEFQKVAQAADGGTQFIKVALTIEPRSVLHERIEQRLDQMIDSGFEDEMRTLRRRVGLTKGHTSMRSVGYRQFWSYLDGDETIAGARDKALFATRQLAKRQLTWLRSEADLFCVDALEARAIDNISKHLDTNLAQNGR